MIRQILTKIFHARLTMLLFAIVTVSALAVGQGNRPSGEEKSKAEKAWEALIRAKGGRDRLHSRTSMLTQFNDVTRLEVFPCTKWEFGHWLDRRPVLEIYNERTKLRIVAGVNGQERVIHQDPDDGCWYNQIPFLLETKWYKPKPLSVRRDKVGKKSLDVIEVVIGDEKLEFAYESEEMLVSEVRFLSDGGVWQKYRFSDYIDVDGIKMPHTFNIGMSADDFETLKGKGIPISFKYNVDYNPKIFEPPFIATSAEAWKRRQ